MMHFSKLHQLLCFLAFVATASAQSSTGISTSTATFSNSSTTSMTSNYITSLPTTTSFSTVTPNPQNVTTTTFSGNGSVTVMPIDPTFIPRDTKAPHKVAGEYKLRTQVLAGAPKRFDKLYLGAWPLVQNYYADLAFTRNKSNAALFYLNGTAEQLDFGVADMFWSMTPGFNTMSSRWYSVTTRSPVGYRYGTFWINGTGLQWTPNTSPPPHTGTLAALDAYFAGWMACDWWHGVPQLFFKVGGWQIATVTPPGCADVLLLEDYF